MICGRGILHYKREGDGTDKQNDMTMNIYQKIIYIFCVDNMQTVEHEGYNAYNKCADS